MVLDPARPEDLVTIQSQLCLVHIKVNDQLTGLLFLKKKKKKKAYWSASVSGKFVCAATWNQIRSRSAEVD